MLKINTVLTGFSTLFMALVCFLGKELWTETRLTHDAVLTVQLRMVNHTEFDTTVAEIRSRQSSIELEIQKMKDHRNYTP